MREIKFRAWDTERLEMAKVISGVGDEEVTLQDEECWQWNTVAHYIAVIMQYTGLKDKNGTEIYEGDILQESTTHPLKVIVSYGHVKIEFYDLGEKITDLFFQEDIDEDGLEVIGNIYEHPHLLKERGEL